MTLIISGTVLLCSSLIMIGGFASGAFEKTPNPTPEITAKATKKPEKESGITVTLEPTITPQSANKAAEHTKDPGYDMYTDPCYMLNIPYPKTFEIIALRNDKGELEYSDEAALLKLENMLVGDNGYGELVFAAKNSTASAIVWVSVVSKPEDTDLKTVYEIHRAVNGGVWDGSCGGDFFYYSSTNGAGGNGNTHYCYCKDRYGRCYAINILYPESKAAVYAPGNVEGYPYELYIRFKESNFD